MHARGSSYLEGHLTSRALHLTPEVNCISVELAVMLLRFGDLTVVICLIMVRNCYRRHDGHKSLTTWDMPTPNETASAE